MRRFLAIFFATTCLVIAGAAPGYAAHSSTATTQRAATPSDSQIEATIRAKLAKSKIGKDGFRFHVQRGVVTWEGTTNVMQHKGSATRMAKAAGAVQVVNHIQVSDSGKASSGLKRAAVQQ